MAAAMGSVVKPESEVRERRWRDRIDRARIMEDEHGAAKSVLRFYGKVLEFQRDVAAASKSVPNSDVPLRDQIDLAFAASRMPALFSLAIKHGPEPLAALANAMQQQGEESWMPAMHTALVVGEPNPPEPDEFFARACLQPIADNLQSIVRFDPNYSESVCPACSAFPQASVLRPEGDGASRWLLCSFCLREWLFRRVVCPWCSETDKEKLPSYSSDECKYVRVEGCDTCRRYLKAVDLSLDGRAVPLVDEVALAVLDVWASDHGYTKINQNLMGF